jgi:formylglycine-generating enzyme required for sulfatase activity
VEITRYNTMMRARTIAGTLGIALVSLAAFGFVSTAAARAGETPNAGEAQKKAISGGLTLVRIPAGETRMKDGGKIVRQTKVSEFHMSAHEISYAVWKKVYDWGTANGYEFVSPGTMGSHAPKRGRPSPTPAPAHVPQEPVLGLTWYDCVLWCNAASEMQGRTPCYYTDAKRRNVYRKGKVDVENSWVRWDVDGYRLPTEAEWDYGCDWKSFSAKDRKTGEPWTVGIQDYGWDGNNSGGTSHPVGTKKPNVFGLHDMYGNAQEWLWDRFRNVHDVEAVEDPRGPDVSDPYAKKPESKVARRLFRGMPFLAKTHPASKRYGEFADAQMVRTGFRVAVTDNRRSAEKP